MDRIRLPGKFAIVVYEHSRFHGGMAQPTYRTIDRVELDPRTGWRHAYHDAARIELDYYHGAYYRNEHGRWRTCGGMPPCHDAELIQLSE